MIQPVLYLRESYFLFLQSHPLNQSFIKGKLDLHFSEI